MTTLTLRIENHATLDNGGPVSLTLTGKGAQVGRKSANDWVLPDASRHISGHHFDITYSNGQYMLTDVSSNGTFLHGERYRLDGTHPIAHGDRFTVGQYIIRAELTEDAPAAVTEPPAMEMPPTQPQAPQGQQQPPVQQAPPPSSAAADEFDDVWGDLGGSGLQAPPRGHTFTPGSTPGVQTPRAYDRPEGSRTQRPDYEQAGTRGGVSPSVPPQFSIPGAGNVSAPPAFRPPPARGPQPDQRPPQELPAQAAHPQPFDQQRPQQAPPPPQQPANPQPPIGAEGFGIAQPAPQPQPAPYPAGQTAAGAPDAFLRAFMDGAGITDTSQLQMSPEQLGRILGQVARIGTDELMRMLQDRAAVKLFVSNEDRTMRVATGNNPMKFMIDAEQAFEALFLKPRDGYLTGADGFENALVDIRRHQAAVIAALQPALAEMLGGLAPDEIEKDVGGGMMGGGARKSWDEFCKRWESRAAQGENGMLDAFIKAFSRHYAEALRKMS